MILHYFHRCPWLANKGDKKKAQKSGLLIEYIIDQITHNRKEENMKDELNM